MRGANTLIIWTWNLESMCSVFSSVLCHFPVRCCSPKRIGILGGSFSLCSLISIFPLVSPRVSLWLLSFVTSMLVQSQLLLVLQEIKVQGLGAVSELDQTAEGGKAALIWKSSCMKFCCATEMAVFLSGLVQVSRRSRALPCYPCVVHTLLNLLSSCPCPISRLGIGYCLTFCICSF